MPIQVSLVPTYLGKFGAEYPSAYESLGALPCENFVRNTKNGSMDGVVHIHIARGLL